MEKEDMTLEEELSLDGYYYYYYYYYYIYLQHIHTYIVIIKGSIETNIIEKDFSFDIDDWDREIFVEHELGYCFVVNINTFYLVYDIYLYYYYYMKKKKMKNKMKKKQKKMVIINIIIVITN